LVNIEVMTKMQRHMMAFMRRIMLSCEEATFVSTKKMVQGVDLRDRMKLRMHLTACKHCRKFYYQTRIIDNALRHHAKTTQSKVSLNRLSPVERSRLQKLISSKIQSQ